MYLNQWQYLIRKTIMAKHILRDHDVESGPGKGKCGGGANGEALLTALAAEFECDWGEIEPDGLASRRKKLERGTGTTADISDISVCIGDILVPMMFQYAPKSYIPPMSLFHLVHYLVFAGLHAKRPFPRSGQAATAHTGPDSIQNSFPKRTS